MSFVQIVAAQTQGMHPVSTFGKSPGAADITDHNTVVVLAGMYGCPAPDSMDATLIEDGLGNSYVPIDLGSGAGPGGGSGGRGTSKVFAWIAQDVVGGNPAFVMSFSPTTGSCGGTKNNWNAQAVALEYSGLLDDAFDVATAAIYAEQTAPASDLAVGSLVTTSAEDELIAFIFNYLGSAGIAPDMQTAGWTSRGGSTVSTSGSAVSELLAWDMETSAAGDYGPSFEYTGSGGNSLGDIAVAAIALRITAPPSPPLGSCGAGVPDPEYLPNLVTPSGESQTVTELDGHSSVGEIDAQAIDPGAELRALAAIPSSAGRIARLKMGFPGMSLLDFTTLHTLQITSVDRNPQGMIIFRMADLQRLLMVQAWVNGGPYAWAPGQDAPPQPPFACFTENDQPISSDNPRYLQGNPIDILLVAMQNELGVGQDRCAAEADWRVYVPGNDASLINPNPYLDVAGAIALRDGQFSGVRFEFVITDAQDGKSWIEDQILKPLGLYWIAAANGQLRLKSMKQPFSTSPLALDDDCIIDTPDTERLPIVNVVQVTPGSADGSQGNPLEFIDDDSVATYRQQYESDAEADGFRAAWGANLLSFLLADKVFRRHASNTPVYSFDVFLSKLKAEVGDFVSITHRLLLDYETALIGVSEILCEVIDRQPDYASGKVSLKCADTRFMEFATPYDIAPLGTPDWTDASSDQKAKYLFISNSSGKYSDGSDGNTIF